jgi:two-component system CheB/CheR fusion protein
MGEVVPGAEQVLVVVGASAGGIDALERLAAALSEQFPAPIVIAQHLAPTHESRLDTILRQRTGLRVVSVSTSTHLVAGTLYVVPAGEDVEISGDRVDITSRGKTKKPVPSIDTLFRSAAKAYGDRVIAVVLTGTGSDGPEGAAAVKEAGGTVIVQDPASAAFPALPASIPPSIVDLVCDIDALGPLLESMVMDGEPSARKLDDEMLRAFLLQLRARSGIDFTEYKSPTIKRRLARLMAAARCATLSDYMRYLNSHPESYQRLVSSFLIKVTGFFRDPALYKHLREQVLPEIIEDARRTRSELRLWSAGCATGEEAYSLAILLSELLGEDVDEFNLRIFATDLDNESVAFARRGIYPASAFGDMPAELRQTYFTKVDDTYQVKKRIRNLTVFGEYDLGQRAPFPRIDLILCRNVLIYFTKELQQRTLQLFAFSLREGGYLVLGKAETTTPLPQYFVSVHPTLKVFRRQGERLLIPAPALGNGTRPERLSTLRSSMRSLTLPHRAMESSARSSINERLGSVVFESDIGVVLVDRNYDIVTINQAARQLLGIHGQGMGEDLIHLAASISGADLKSALDEALRGVKGVPRVVEVNDPAFDETKILELRCYPERSSKEPSVSGAFVVMEDVTARVAAVRERERESSESRERLQRLSKQNEELLDRLRKLSEANHELTAANSELRSSNEHLLIAAEEAEASAEEVETLNEEMQATSEELETLNEELQATVEELNTTNEELGARGEELERAARERQSQLDLSERLRMLFERALDKSPIAAALVDPSGHVRKATELYVKHAAANHGKLPAVGQSWEEIPDEIELGLDGISVSYSVSVIDLPSDHTHIARLVVLSP